MAANAVPVYLDQMDRLLAPMGFRTIELPGTAEIVFAKAFRHICSDDKYLPISLRIYTSIVGISSRGVGDDAIRVSAWAKTPIMINGVITEGIVMLGGSKRVHRVEHWRENLIKRLTIWKEMIEPLCPECDAPMLLRKPRNGQHWQPFYGCIRYANTAAQCKGTRAYVK